LRLKVYSSHYALDATEVHRVSGTGISDLLSGTHRDERDSNPFSGTAICAGWRPEPPI